MKTISFAEIKPFVRYSRIVEQNPYNNNSELYSYDSRLFYCTEGSGRIFIDSKEYTMQQGSLFLWKSGLCYKYHADSVGKLKFLAINFDFQYGKNKLTSPIPPDKEDSFDHSKITEEISFSDAVVFNSPIVIENAHAYYDRLSEINREFVLQKAFYETRISGLFTDILGQIALDSLCDSKKANRLVNDIIEYMEQNLSEKLSNKTIGEIFKYHPNYINQLFSKYTGKSLHLYLQDLRMSKALQLISDTNLSVSEIALNCGFEDFPHFSKAFKKKTGFSPSKFRP